MNHIQIKYSIIIPHYNSVILLQKLLETIPKSPEIQVIVVDDNSNENIELLAEVIRKDNRCEFYKCNSDKKGAGACRNKGLKYAEGKWILFADSDDYFIDDFISKIEKYYSSHNDVLFFTPTSIEIDTEKVSDRHLYYEDTINKYLKYKDKKSELNLRYNFFVPWSKMIKRSFIKKHQIEFDEVYVSNDVMFSIKIGYYMKIFQATKEIIYCVTKNKGSLTTTINEKNFDMRLHIFFNRYQYLHTILPEEKWKILSIRGGSVLIDAILQGFGIKKVINLVIIMKNNNIKIFAWRFLDPIRLIKVIIKKIKIRNSTKKYEIKE